jgi:AhpD family alkylhydroperoxidase
MPRACSIESDNRREYAVEKPQDTAMSRISKVNVADWDPELRRMTAADSGSPIEVLPMQIFANVPALAKGIVGLGLAFRESRSLPERLIEIVRLRIAYHNQCRSCMAIRYRSAVADGVDEELVCAIENPNQVQDLSVAEQAALAYADRFANDHLSIDDGVYEGLRAHFSEAQIVELGCWIAFCVGFGRLGATWDMVEELPSEFHQRGTPPLKPSIAKPLIVR